MNIGVLLSCDPDDLPRLLETITESNATQLVEVLASRAKSRIGATLTVQKWANTIRELLISHRASITKTTSIELIDATVGLWRRPNIDSLTRISLLRLIATALDSTPDLPPQTLRRASNIFKGASRWRSPEVRDVAISLQTGRTAIARIVSVFQRSSVRALSAPAVPLGIDIPRASAHVLSDSRGDWYRDPWRWLEVRWLGEVSPQVVLDRIAAGVPSPSLPLDVPKPYFGLRPASIMGALDRVAYQALVDSVAPQLLSSLPSWVYGWRTRAPSASLYSNNSVEFAHLLQERERHSRKFKFALRLDIESFFANITPNMLTATLSQRELEPSAITAISTFVHRLELVSIRRGLPQRSLASAVLAQAILRPIDETLEQLTASGTVAAIRWMDDFEIYGDSTHVLEDIADILRDKLEAQGLPLNVAKTFITESKNSPRVQQDDHDSSALAELFTDEHAPARFELGLHLRNLTSNSKRRFRTWLAAILDDHSVDRLGYAADQLARLALATGAWRDYRGWYQSSLRQHPFQADWVPHAWSRMFPRTASQHEVRTTVDAYGERIEVGRMPYTLLPNALKQIRQWKPRDLMDYCRSAARHVEYPFELRAVALAASRNGPHDREVHGWYSATFETHLTRLAFEHFGTADITLQDQRPERSLLGLGGVSARPAA